MPTCGGVWHRLGGDRGDQHVEDLYRRSALVSWWALEVGSQAPTKAGTSDSATWWSVSLMVHTVVWCDTTSERIWETGYSSGRAFCDHRRQFLLTALANLQSRHQMYGNQISETVSATIQRFPATGRGRICTSWSGERYLVLRQYRRPRRGESVLPMPGRDRRPRAS